MLKRFEGIFKRFTDQPTPMIPEVLLEMAENDEALRQEIEAQPKYRQFRTNGDAFAVLREITDSRLIPRDDTAEVNIKFAVKGDEIHLTFEVESEDRHELLETEKAVRHSVTNHHGKFRDISSAMAR